MNFRTIIKISNNSTLSTAKLQYDLVALENEMIAGAGLDVISAEPPKKGNILGVGFATSPHEGI